MFSLNNLSSLEIFRRLPWEFTGRETVPDRGIEDKAVRDKWITNPLTKYDVYSLFEGANPNGRVSKCGGGGEGNAPVLVHGLAVDYDLPLTEEQVAKSIAAMNIKPNWIERTLSGNWRLVWLFEKPVPMASFDFARYWQQHINELIWFDKMAGVDEGALTAPERYYTNGGIWKPGPATTPVPWALLQGHLVKISNKFNFTGPEFGPTIPLPIVADQLRQRFPKFAEWPGDFSLNAQGPSFWVEGSESPKSAIVRETGIQTFSDHANGKGFFNWSELIGAEFVRQYKLSEIGRAVEGIYFDDRQYFKKDKTGRWCPNTQENIRLFLITERGLSDIKRKGENFSAVQEALTYLLHSHRVRTAAPFAFFPEGRTLINGESVLNTFSKEVLKPADGPQKWGAEGNFPFLSNFFETFFDPPEQLPFFLSWLAYAYKSFYEKKPRSGQVVFIAGGVNVGKTFLTRGIVSGLFSGHAEANQFLMGEDLFNAELFDCGLWTVDDGSIAANPYSHRRFSEMVKRLAANHTIRCNGKYLKAVNVGWQGRIMFTLNLDTQSGEIIPDLDLSLREKIMIFRAVIEAAVQFLPQDQMEEMLARELPYFARWLLDYEIPAHCRANDPRFFVKSYLEQSLVNTANQSSGSAAFSEIIEEWGRENFQTRDREANFWEGTSLQLFKAVMQDPLLTEVLRGVTVQKFGQQLGALAMKKIFRMEIIGNEHRRLFRIHRDSRWPKPAPARAIIANT